MKKLNAVLLIPFLFVACKSNTSYQDKVIERTKPMGKLTEPTKPYIEEGKNYKAIIHTDKGDITVDLFEKEAPLSVTNFVQLSGGGFYNNLAFHRVEPGFVIQGGDPEGTGSGGPGYTIAAEIEGNPHKHLKGALAWARTGDQVNPERRSSGSQFYITLSPTPFLDNQYTVFGQTTGGIDVTEKIAAGDKIKSIEIIKE